MKVSAFIPYWLDYQVDTSGKHKNLKKLGGKYLINYSIDLLNSVREIDDVSVYCSDESVDAYIDQDLKYRFVKRDKCLDDKDVSIDTIIKSFLEINDADVIVLLHPNSPFLSSNTVSDCLNQVISGKYDSAFTAYSFQKLAWFKSKPLNYALNEETPKLKNLDPVIIEESSLYVFTRDSFAINNKRIGNNPYIKCINHFEGLEVESDEDFEIAELIVNSGMYPKVEYAKI
jgi:CMP-N-acetylneuraminic acid synthetase